MCSPRSVCWCRVCGCHRCCLCHVRACRLCCYCRCCCCLLSLRFSLQFLSLLLLLLRSVMVSHASSLLLRCCPAVAVAVAPTVAPHQVPSEILLHRKEKLTNPPCALLTLTTENMRTTNPMFTQKMVSHASSLLLRCLLLHRTKFRVKFFCIQKKSLRILPVLC